MGIMDKLKSTAQDVATEAKKVSVQAQGKIEETQLRRKTDDAAKRLGYLVYRERSKGTPAGSEADQLIAEITSLEAQQETAQTAAAQRIAAAEAGSSQPSAAGVAPEGQTGAPAASGSTPPPAPPAEPEGGPRP